MTTASPTVLRSKLREYLDQRETVVVMEAGHPRAVLVPVADEEEMERLLMANSSELRRILAEADCRISETGGVPHDEFWTRAGEAAPQ